MNVVLVSEMNPPEGEQPIEWVLLTTLPISTLSETITIVEYYTTRWMIEVFSKTLKSGCLPAQAGGVSDRGVAGVDDLSFGPKHAGGEL
jgi:hypothetical protein